MKAWIAPCVSHFNHKWSSAACIRQSHYHPNFKMFVYLRINHGSMEVNTCHINTNFIIFLHEYHHEMHHKHFFLDFATYRSYHLPIKPHIIYSPLVSQYHYLIEQSTDLTHAHEKLTELVWTDSHVLQNSVLKHKILLFSINFVSRLCIIHHSSGHPVPSAILLVL